MLKPFSWKIIKYLIKIKKIYLIFKKLILKNFFFNQTTILSFNNFFIEYIVKTEDKIIAKVSNNVKAKIFLWVSIIAKK